MSARALLAGVLLAGACACGGQRSLEGSLTELMDLHYTEVNISSSSSAVAVKYTRPQGDGENVVLEVSARTGGLMLEAGVPINLAELGPDGAQRGSVGRNVFNDPRRQFPPMERGMLLLHSLPASGMTVQGEFTVTFVNGIQFANGRTVFGTFEARIP